MCEVQTLVCLYWSLSHSLFCIAVCLKKDGYSIMTWEHAIGQLVSVPLVLVPAKCWIMPPPVESMADTHERQECLEDTGN